MMVSLPFFSEPVSADGQHIPVVCIENSGCFLQTVAALQSGQPEENNIVFSENYIPFSFAKYGFFLTDYVHYFLPPALVKKLYAHIETICQTDMAEEAFAVKQAVISFLDTLNGHLDYAFLFEEDCPITGILKMQSFLPDFQGDQPIETLLNFLILLCELQPLRCCVLLHLHQYFTEEQLQPFFREIVMRHIPLILLEGTTPFIPSAYEKRWILDRDLCEILAPDRGV